MTTMIDIQNMARASAANTNFANGDPFVLENFDSFFADFTKTFHNYLMKINADEQKLRIAEYYYPGHGLEAFYTTRRIKPK